MNEHELIERGERAAKILNDDVYKSAWSDVYGHIHKMIDDAPIRDEEGIVKAKQLLHCLSLVRSALEQTMQTGKVTAATLEEKRRGVSYLGDIWQSRRKR